MPQGWQAVVFAVNLVVAASSSISAPTVVATAPFQTKFVRSTMGREIRICLDGGKIETEFAGKMLFQDASGSWSSVCADVRAPVSKGQVFWVRAMRTSKVGGNYEKAGNIVAKYFRSAQSADECAALQIAVWKAIEDGTDQPDFGSGHLQVQASEAVMSLAANYYQAVASRADAAITGTTMSSGQSQLTPLVE